MNGFNPYTSSVPFIPNYTNPQPIQQSGCNVNWIYVSGFDGARNQIVQPGQTCWMMDNNEPAIYVKSVDNMGTATLKGFGLTEITQQSTAGTHNEMTGYVKVSDLEAVIGRVKAIEDVIGGLQG